MSLGLDDLRHVAALAMLGLSTHEEQLLLGQLNRVLDYMAKLREVDTSNIPPAGQVGVLACPTRCDAPRQGLSRDAALENTPRHEKGYVKVPRVI
jgi:aspartyl-tRNA(Asn)/glutamyl-tRNA(Gln) amidotransferase subunit C